MAHRHRLTPPHILSRARRAKNVIAKMLTVTALNYSNVYENIKSDG